MHASRHGATGVLVQPVGGVRFRVEPGTGGIAARSGGLAVADVVVVVGELLASDQGPIGPIAPCAGQFVPVVVRILLLGNLR